jgi:polyhydroxybutyrate depolymerase
MKLILGSLSLALCACIPLPPTPDAGSPDAGGAVPGSSDAGAPATVSPDAAPPPLDGSSWPDGAADVLADAAASADASDATDAASPPRGSAGCGRPAVHASGGAQVSLQLGAEAGGDRGFYISVPRNYDPDAPHRVVLGFPGTDWLGKQMQPYLGLETAAPAAPNEIFAYMDPQWHDFAGWGRLGGWLLGPNGGPATGMEDLRYTEAVLDYLASNYCIDTTRIFATGQSWGGDMTQVVSCFLSRFRATAPVAANDPYWFRNPTAPVHCASTTAVWTFYGKNDTSFNDQGANGRKVRDFWLAERGCTGVEAARDLGITYGAGTKEDCVEYTGCSSDVRYCAYAEEFGHQIPRAYFAAEVMKYFRSF